MLHWEVPPVPFAPEPASVAWLRAHVARFSGGAVHERRRGYVVAELATFDPVKLRREAFELASRALAAGSSLEEVAWTVPVGVLAPGLADDVCAVARVYLPGNGEDPAADEAVGRLVAVFGAGERGAARIGLLVQACAATAGLITRALARVDAGTPALATVLDTLRLDPPVRGTRRIDPRDGASVFVDLAAANLPFGDGAHRCPGREHAIALAAGVVEAAR